MSYIPQSNLYDKVTDKYAFIDRFRNLRVANTKRIIGSNFGSSIDTTYLYTVTTAGTGTATANAGVATLATGTTANGAATLVTKGKIRYLSGRNNLNRFVYRFSTAGTTNNVRELGIYVDANNSYVMRLSGTTLSFVLRKAGVETVVSNGAFNGNGLSSNLSITVDSNYHSLEILVAGTRIVFIVDDEAIHTFYLTTASLVSSLVGQLYVSNTNSGGSTTNVSLELLNWSGNQIGDAINNPQFYHINAIAETRTLKGGGGTLQSMSVGRAGGTGAAITLYDSLTASGTIIGIWDLTKDQTIGNHTFGIEGVNFYNGLTYTTTGTMTNGSITLFWE